jgi:hypothetical protein
MRNGLLVAASFILVGSGVFRAQNYFPLAVGNRWEYIDEARERRVIVEVTGVDEIDNKKWSKVRWLDGTERSLRVDAQGQLVELDRRQNKEVVWVDFASPPGKTYETKNDPCGDGAHVTAEDANRIEIAYNNRCLDGGLQSEIYIDSVGLSERIRVTYAGPMRYRLVSARIASRELSF